MRRGVVDGIDLDRVEPHVRATARALPGSVRPVGRMPSGHHRVDDGVATVEDGLPAEALLKLRTSGSEIRIPMPGWPMIGSSAHWPSRGRSMAPAWVRPGRSRPRRSGSPASPVSPSFLDLGQAEDLRVRAEFLALALSIAIGNTRRSISITTCSSVPQHGEHRPVRSSANGRPRHSSTTSIYPPPAVSKLPGRWRAAPSPRCCWVVDARPGRPPAADRGADGTGNAGELARPNHVEHLRAY